MDHTQIAKKTRELLIDLRQFLKRQRDERKERVEKLAAALADSERTQATIERNIASRADQMDAALIQFLKNIEE